MSLQEMKDYTKKSGTGENRGNRERSRRMFLAFSVHSVASCLGVIQSCLKSKLSKPSGSALVGDFGCRAALAAFPTSGWPMPKSCVPALGMVSPGWIVRRASSPSRSAGVMWLSSKSPIRAQINPTAPAWDFVSWCFAAGIIRFWPAIPSRCRSDFLHPGIIEGTCPLCPPSPW